MADEAKSWAEQHLGGQHPARQPPRPTRVTEAEQRQAAVDAAEATLAEQPPVGPTEDIFDAPLNSILKSGGAHARANFAATSADRREGDLEFRRARAEAAAESPGPRVDWKPVIQWMESLTDDQRDQIERSDYYWASSPANRAKLKRLAEEVTQNAAVAEFAEHGGAPLHEPFELDEPEVDYAAGDYESEGPTVKGPNDVEGQRALEAWLDAPDELADFAFEEDDDDLAAEWALQSFERLDAAAAEVEQGGEAA
jgi:hypothetical protein